MQTQDILVLDLSASTPRADLVAVYGKSIELKESVVSSVRDVLGRNVLAAPIFPAAQADSEGTSPVGATCAWPPPETTTPVDNSEVAAQALRDMLAQITLPWAHTVLIIPPYDYLSLVVKLPFENDRLINKVLALETQDKVPFDLSEFLLCHNVLGVDEKGVFDVRVSMIPKETIAKSLALCKKAALEPYLITTPQSCAAALGFVIGDIADHSAVLYEHDPFYYFAFLGKNAQVIADRVIERHSLTERAPDEAEKINLRSVVSALRSTLASFEHEHNPDDPLAQQKRQKLSRIYFAGTYINVQEMSSLLGRPLEELHSAEFIKGTSKDIPLGVLGAVYVQDTFEADAKRPPVFTNFRIKDFAYSPKLQDLLETSKKVLPAFLATVCLCLAVLTAIYWCRSIYIGSVRRAIGQQVRQLVPNISVPDGMELDALRNETISLESQLKDLGSLARFSPLDTLLEITKDFPSEQGVAIKSVQIKNSKVRIEGVSPDVAAREAIERVLRAKRDKYCHVETKQEGSGSGMFNNSGMRGFSVDLVLCD